MHAYCVHPNNRNINGDEYWFLKWHPALDFINRIEYYERSSGISFLHPGIGYLAYTKWGYRGYDLPKSEIIRRAKGGKIFGSAKCACRAFGIPL